MTTPIQFAADTHVGLKRDHNEDCFRAAPELGLWLVADGVGGHSCGEVASDIVQNTIGETIASGQGLAEAIATSHRNLLQRIETDAATAGMGSTVIALLIRDDHYQINWVGDSRAYLWYPRLRQLSEDHNRASELLASNLISAAEASTHPERHVLTQSLGVSDKMALSPGEIHGTLQKGEQIILCSDGLSDDLSDAMITKLMSDHHTPQAQVDALLKAALDAGGSDNITVVVVGECAPIDSDPTASDLETTHNVGRTNDTAADADKFPWVAVLLVSALAVAILLFTAS